MLLLALQSAAIGYAALLATTADFREESEKKAAALARVLSAPLERAARLRIELNELRGVGDFIAGEAEGHRDIVYVAVSGGDGRTVHRYGREPSAGLLAEAARRALAGESMSILNDGRLVQVTVPLLADGVVRGAVHVAVEPGLAGQSLLARLTGLLAAALIAFAFLVEMLAVARRRWLADRLAAVLTLLRGMAGQQHGVMAVAGGDEVGDLARRANLAARRGAAEHYIFAGWAEEVRASQIDLKAQAGIDAVRARHTIEQASRGGAPPDLALPNTGAGRRLSLFLVLSGELALWPLWPAHALSVGLAPFIGAMSAAAMAVPVLAAVCVLIGLAASGRRPGRAVQAGLLLAAALATAAAGSVDQLPLLLALRAIVGAALAGLVGSAGSWQGGGGRGELPTTVVLASACVAGPALGALLPQFGFCRTGLHRHRSARPGGGGIGMVCRRGASAAGRCPPPAGARRGGGSAGQPCPGGAVAELRGRDRDAARGVAWPAGRDGGASGGRSCRLRALVGRLACRGWRQLARADACWAFHAGGRWPRRGGLAGARLEPACRRRFAGRGNGGLLAADARRASPGQVSARPLLPLVAAGAAAFGIGILAGPDLASLGAPAALSAGAALLALGGLLGAASLASAKA